MRTEEIASRLATIKIRLQATDLHTLTLRVEEVENLIEEYTSQLWTSPCICPTDEKTGETLCCNHCGKPTARTESKELPGDDRMVIDILNKIVVHSKKCRDTEVGHGVVVALANECLILLNDKHDLLASRDARTESKELPGDEALKARYGVAEGHIMGAQYMGSIASPLLASKDARIRELEEELRLERFQEDDSHLYDDEDDHFVQCDDCKQPDACRDFGCYKDELTPPKN